MKSFLKVLPSFQCFANLCKFSFYFKFNFSFANNPGFSKDALHVHVLKAVLDCCLQDSTKCLATAFLCTCMAAFEIH